MKTDIDIKDDIYRHLEHSPLVAEATGTLSKTLRPHASRAEDIVISVLSSDAEGDLVTAIVQVNLYVAGVLRDGKQIIEASDRLRKLSRMCYDALRVGYAEDDGYRFELTSQRILPVEDTGEHLINNRLKYQALK